MPISKTEIIPELLKECPEFQQAWDEHNEFWKGEAPGDYNDASGIINALIKAYGRGCTAFFPRFFGFVERLITDGDAEVRNIAVVGYLETLQTSASWEEYGPEVFVQWMQPESKKWWNQIRKWWEGGKNLMDIAIEEAEQNKNQR